MKAYCSQIALLTTIVSVALSCARVAETEPPTRTSDGSAVAAEQLRAAAADPEHEQAFVTWLAERRVSRSSAADSAAETCIAMVRRTPSVSFVLIVNTSDSTRVVTWDVPSDWTRQQAAPVLRGGSSEDRSPGAEIERARAAILLQEYSGTHFDREFRKGPDGRRSGRVTFSTGGVDLSRAYWAAQLKPGRNWETTGFSIGLVGKRADGPQRARVARRGVCDLMLQIGTLASEPDTIDGHALEGRLGLFRAIVSMAMSRKGPLQLVVARSALALPFSGAITPETSSAWRDAATPLKSLATGNPGPLADELDAVDALCTALGGGPEHLRDALELELGRDRPRCVIVSAIADRWTSASGRDAEAALRVLAEEYAARPVHDRATRDVLRSYVQAESD